MNREEGSYQLSHAYNFSWHIYYLLCQKPDERNDDFILLMKTSGGS